MKILLLFLIIACLALIGCPAFSAHPLYTDQDSFTEPALEGAWSTPNTRDNEVLTFEKLDNHQYRLSVYHPDTKVTDNYTVHPVRLEGQTYLDLLADEQAIGEKKLDGPIGVIPTHVILKVKISGDDLAYATWEDDAFRKQEKRSAGLDYQLVEGGVLVTAPTDLLRRYIAAHTQDVFSAPEHLKRKSKAQP